MSAQGLEVIDTAAHTTHAWLNELADRLDWSSRKSALRLLRTVLHLVRDHLMINELAQFSAQMPLLIRGMLFEGWMPKTTPIKDRSAQGFMDAVQAGMGQTPEYRGPEDIRHVFLVLNGHVSEGEIADVRASLPADLRALWPEP